MGKQIQVAIYGQSVMLAGVETILRSWPEVDVTRLAPALQGLPDLAGLEPDAILFDSTTPEAADALLFLKQRPGLILIGLDIEDNQAIVLSSQAHTVITTDDLTRVIALTNEASTIQSDGRQKQMRENNA